MTIDNDGPGGIRDSIRPKYEESKPGPMRGDKDDDDELANK